MIVSITSPPPCPECGELCGHKWDCDAACRTAEESVIAHMEQVLIPAEKEKAFRAGLMEAARIARESVILPYDGSLHFRDGFNAAKHHVASAIEARAREGAG